MKVIYTNNITAVAVSEENSNYPKENLLDDHPRKVWRATSKDATITLTLSSATAVAIFNTNAASATVTLKNGGSTITSAFYDLSGIYDYYSWLNDLGEAQYSLWFDYGDYPQGGSHTVEFALDTLSATTTLQAGVAFGGLAYQTERGIRYGAKEGLEDYSIKKELSNGSRYWRKRDVVRSFSCSMILGRSTRDFYMFMGRIAQAAGPKPLAWKLTNESAVDWTVYAYFSQLPSGSHDYPDGVVVDFSLTEEV